MMTQAQPRIAFVTAGAAGMYCGSCLRDNALAAALMRLGCEVSLIPVYTPIRTDEEDVSLNRLFFGGVNVYLQQRFPIFRYLPRFLDRPLDQPWLVRKLAARSIETDSRQLGELTLSMLRGEEGYQRKEIHRFVDWLKREARPQLVNLPNILMAGCLPALKRELGVPVLVTLQGEDLFIEDLPPTFREKVMTELRRLAGSVDGFIVFSRDYAAFMSQYLEVSESKLQRVPLGLNLADYDRPPGPARPPSRPPVIGYLARVCPEKGFDLLVDAFLQLREMEGAAGVRVEAAGWLSAKDRDFLAIQLKKLQEAGAQEDFQYRGVLDRSAKLEFLRGIDLFSVPTTYREPKGLFVLEAMASGVPVVQPDHGAFPELLEATGGGILVAPHDAGQLARALYGLIRDRELRGQLGSKGRQRVLESFGAEAMAQRTLEVYRKFL